MKVHPKRLRWISKRLIWAFIGVIVVLVVFAGMRIRSNTKIGALQVHIAENELDLHFVREEDVRESILRAFGHYMEGEAIGKLDVAAVESMLEQNLFIREAQVYIDAQANAHITIKQREPVLRVRDELDKTDGYYLDINGDSIPTSPHYTARVLTLTGDVGKWAANFREVEAHRLNRVFPLVQFILKHEFWKAQIEQIHFETTGEVVLVPKIGDHIIIFGKPEDEIEAKFKRLRTFYDEGLARFGWEKYKSINIAYKNQVVCKKR